MKKKINNDVYNISQRIKQVDKDYYIVFETKTNKFEKKKKKQKGGSLCLVLPFDRLDVRTLNLVYKTQVKWFKENIMQIEKNNERLERVAHTNTMDIAKSQLFDIIKYESNTTSNDHRYFQTEWH